MTFPSAWERLQRSAELLATDLEASGEVDDRVNLSKELRAILMDLKKHAEPAPSEEKPSSEVSSVVNLRNRRAKRRSNPSGGELPAVRGDVG